jgi:predicted nucleic acid-binding Zn ribbon protein
VAKGKGSIRPLDRHRAERVGDVLERWIRRSGALRVSDRERVAAAWEEMLGDEAAHARLEILKNHVATFVVDSSALLSELASFRKQELLEGLQERVRTYFVRDIRFRLEKRRPGGRRDRRSR